MPEYDNELRGVLFRNEKKQSPDDKRPNMKGECQIDGVRYWVSAWTKDGAKGRFQSLQFERAEDRHQPANRQTGGAAPAPAAEAPAPTAEDFGMTPGTDPEDIPF